MCRCNNCGVTIPSGAVCTSCARPFDAAVAEIGRKVRRVRYRRTFAGRWMWSGAKTGFAVGFGLSLFLVAIMVIAGLAEHRMMRAIWETLGIFLLVSLEAAIILSLVFAAIFFVFGAVVKPIFVALFCSVERFEQEYGASKDGGGNRWS